MRHWNTKRDFSIRGRSSQNQFYWPLNGKNILRGAKQIHDRIEIALPFFSIRTLSTSTLKIFLFNGCFPWNAMCHQLTLPNSVIRCEFHVTKLFILFLSYSTLFLFNHSFFKFKTNTTKIFYFRMNIQQPHMSYMFLRQKLTPNYTNANISIGVTARILGLRIWSYKYGVMLYRKAFKIHHQFTS